MTRDLFIPTAHPRERTIGLAFTALWRTLVYPMQTGVRSMKRSALFFIFLGCTMMCSAQMTTFMQRYRIWSENGLHNLKATFDGGCILGADDVPEHDSVSQVPRTFCCLVKFDPAGIIEWSKKFPITDGQAKPVDNCTVTQTWDSGYAVANSYVDTMTGSWWIFVLRTDKNGNLQWMRKYPGLGSSSVNCIIETPDHGLAMAGNTLLSATYYAFLLKLNPSGVLAWAKSIRGVGATMARCVRNTSDGGLVFSGDDASGFFLIKTTLTGTTSWSNYYGTGNQWAGGIAITSSGDIVATSNDFNYTVRIVKMDNSGTVISGVRTVVNSPGRIQVNTIDQASDGGFILSSDYGVGFADGFGILKVDAAFNYQWCHLYPGIKSGSGIANQTASVESDGSFIFGFAEVRYPTNPWFNGWHYYVIRTDTLGHTGCQDTLVNVPIIPASFSVTPAPPDSVITGDAVFNVPIIDIVLNGFDCNDEVIGSAGATFQEIQTFTIYPNPSNGLFIIHSRVKGKLKIFNTTGELVLFLDLQDPEEQVDLSRFSKGIYLVSMETPGIIYSQRLILEE
jgi:hypothetical protein